MDSIAQWFVLKEVGRTDFVGDEHGMRQPHRAVRAVGHHLRTEKETVRVIARLCLLEAELADDAVGRATLLLGRTATATRKKPAASAGLDLDSEYPNSRLSQKSAGYRSWAWRNHGSLKGLSLPSKTPKR